MRVVGVDVGIRHLALVELACEPDLPDAPTVLGATRLINIMEYTHNRVPEEHCTLHHTNHLSDRLEHFWQEHGDLLAEADLVAIEQQPITGLVGVEAFLFGKCRDCVEVVSPNRLHTWVFGTRHGLNYEQRKVAMEMHAAALCGRLSSDPTRWDRATRDLPRRHDVADALLIAWFAYQQRRALLRDEAMPSVHAGARLSPHFGGWPAGAKGRRWRAEVERSVGEAECR